MTSVGSWVTILSWKPSLPDPIYIFSILVFVCLFFFFLQFLEFSYSHFKFHVEGAGHK